MREVSFVKRIKFNFPGSVTKRALVIGDADNDKHNELVCANLQGDLAIFKERNTNRYAYATDLGMVTACLIGDILNSGRNYITAINMEGWLYIFNVLENACCSNPQSASKNESKSIEQTAHNQEQELKLNILYSQRMPANCKELLIADLDGDGQNEIIIGLTDRVLRTYKWVNVSSNRGKFVGLHKWEFADQIGSVSLNPSRHENCQDILVAQPGGTYARLECFDKTNSNSSSSSPREQRHSSFDGQGSNDKSESSNQGDNVKTEYISKLTPEYHQLALTQMRNHHISTEVLGGIKNGKDSDIFSLIVIATLDGTLMLVNKDEILWSMQVDHQLFALSLLESNSLSKNTCLPQSESTCTIVPNTNLNSPSTSLSQETNSDNRSQYFVACAWNGKTYIIDEERNYLRFKFNEAVSAFTAGNYYFDGEQHASLAYATFNNKIVLYYDVVSDRIRPEYLLNEIMNNKSNTELLKRLEILSDNLNSSGIEHNQNQDKMNRLHNLLQDILYSFTDEEIITS